MSEAIKNLLQTYQSALNEANIELVGDGRSKKETSRINSNDLVNLSPAAALQKQID